MILPWPEKSRYEALRDRSFRAVAVCMVDGGPEYEAAGEPPTPVFFWGFRWPVPNHLFCKIINDILNESKIQVEHSESYQMCKVLRKLSESCPWRTWHWFPWITRNSKALCQLPDPPNFHRSTTKRRSKRWWSLWMSLHLYHGTLPIYSKRFRKTPRKFYLCNHPLMRWHWKEQLHHVSTTWTGQVIWGRVNTMPGVPNGVPK